MGLLWCSRIEKDKKYYINENFNTVSLLSLSQDLEKATQEIKELQQLIAFQYSIATRTVEYKRIVATKNQNRYSKDKKIYIQISVYKYLMLDGVEVKKESIHNHHKQFQYSDLKEAAIYIKSLKTVTNEYINSTGYKQLNNLV